VVLENGISTRGAKAGDSVYFHTSFPITQNNRVVVPVGSYLRGELIESKRPGKVKGRGEFRMRLDTLIFPNGYTVDLNATPRSADSGGKETMDSEGKITGGSGKGKDAQTVAETTAAGAGIGAIAGRRPGRSTPDARSGSRIAARLNARYRAGARASPRRQSDPVQ
jgi:type IV secretion system protein VirB10